VPLPAPAAAAAIPASRRSAQSMASLVAPAGRFAQPVRKDSRTGNRISPAARPRPPRGAALRPHFHVYEVAHPPVAAPHQAGLLGQLAVEEIGLAGPRILHVPLQPAVAHRRAVQCQPVLVATLTGGGLGRAALAEQL